VLSADPSQPIKAVNVTNLSTLIPGQSAIVASLQGSRDFNRQLLRMGLSPGTTVRFIRRAPLGDPLHFAAGNFELSLRKSTAQKINIELLEDLPD
jgi:Fe2+ transport system protein FeoA